MVIKILKILLHIKAGEKKYRAYLLNVQRQTLRPYMRMTHTFPYLAHTYVLLC